VRAPFHNSAIDAYETLLGRRAQDGTIRVGNVGVSIEDDSSTARLASMVFATPSLDKAAKLLERRGVPGEMGANRLTLSTSATHQVPIALIQRNDGEPASPLKESDEASSISALDHVVVRTPNPERAIALYAGRLGLDLRLDRSNPQWNARLLFFRCGDTVVEISHDLRKGIGDGPDELWGLSWRTPDIARCHARLRRATHHKELARVEHLVDSAARAAAIGGGRAGRRCRCSSGGGGGGGGGGHRGRRHLGLRVSAAVPVQPECQCSEQLPLQWTLFTSKKIFLKRSVTLFFPNQCQRSTGRIEHPPEARLSA
jgi:catechol 2,3-dioxygenase-like lactoylglutathione lyase family enzyme